MRFRRYHFISALLCLSLCFSCKEKEDPVPPYKDTIYPAQNLLKLSQVFPDLDKFPSIQFNEEVGYYLSLGKKEWSRSLSVDPVSIPAQSRSFHFDATRYEADDFSGWEVSDTWDIVLEDIPDHLGWGECPSTFKMTLSLGENAPYRKVTVSDMIITFPSGIRAHAEGADYFLPDLEVTAEGTVVTFRLDAMGFSDQLFEKDGKRCFPIPTEVFALVTALPEDAVDPGSGMPATLSFQSSFEFDRVDFTKCNLSFPDLSFPPEELVWDPVQLPSFLCGEGTDVNLTHFRVLFNYRNDIPMVSRVNAVVRSDDREAAFSAEGGVINHMYMAYLASNHHEGYSNVHVPALGALIRSPFPDGAVQPSLLLQPVYGTSGYVVPGQEYRMSVQAEMVLPLAFNGKVNVGSFETPPIEMNGRTLGARANHKQRFTLELGSDLPVDSRVTPVFTMVGEAPRYLEEFVLDKSHRITELSLVFVPENDNWQATLHFIVTPLRGWNEPIRKNYQMDVIKFHFSANLPEK